MTARTITVRLTEREFGMLAHATAVADVGLEDRVDDAEHAAERRRARADRDALNRAWRKVRAAWHGDDD